MVNAIKKGKRAEVDLCKLLDEKLRLPELRKFSEKTQRNYNQAEGGADIYIEDFIIEVKHRETLQLDHWWNQVIVAAKNHPNGDLIPVVALRQNRKPWEFLLPAKLLGLKHGYIRLTESAFISYANNLIWNEEN